jgi:hypothetical protein
MQGRAATWLPYREARAALGVAGGRLRSHPLRPALVVLGGGLVARQQSLSRTLADVPESAQGFRADRFGLTLDPSEYRRADREVRRVLAGLPARSARRVMFFRTFFRALHGDGQLVEIAAADRLPGAAVVCATHDAAVIEAADERLVLTARAAKPAREAATSA